MKRLFLLVGILAALVPMAVAAATPTYRVTGTDQAGNTTVLYCDAAKHCHSEYGYVYGDPTTVTGGLSKSKPAARGYTWAYVGPVSATCRPDSTVTGLELLCTW